MAASPLRISRRRALALAAVGTAGAAGLGVTAGRRGSPAAGVAGPAGPAGAWSSPLADASAAAAHLLRRAGLGYGDAELGAAAAMPYADLVESLVSQSPEALPQPADPADAAAVVRAWYAHMATTRSPFAERMLLFWHGLLTSDHRKANGRPYVWQQNVTFREHATGDLRSLLLAATHDPLMTAFLDLERSTGASPNENYSRELMELFTLGPGHYTEIDVREGARALSGIRTVAVDRDGSPVRLPRPADGTPQARQAVLDQLAEMTRRGLRFTGRVVPRLHDQGVKTFLGRSGNLGPEEVVDTLLAQDACALHIARRAITSFALPAPDDAFVARVAGRLRSSRYDIRAMVREILLSDEFRSPAAYRALVRSPVDYSVATMRALGSAALAGPAAAAGRAMDQVLYEPPNVGGWPQNGGWLSSGSLLARVNFAEAVAGSATALPDAARAVATQLDDVLGSATAAVLAAATSSADRWYALLASPEFHLK